MKPLTISPDTSYEAAAFTTTIDTGKAAGHYTAVFAVPPDTIRAAFHEFPVGELFLEAADRESWIFSDFFQSPGSLMSCQLSGGIGRSLLLSSNPDNRIIQTIHYIK